jgi:NADH dehydrogenase (ubiquinone) 1 alpha subcomplex subunit 6
MAANAVKITRQVKPLISVTPGDARIRVLSLYKAWYRHIPYMVKDMDIQPSVTECRDQLRANFNKNAHLKDIRVIDMLVVKGQQDLKEVVEHWKQPTHIMEKWFVKEIEKEQVLGFPRYNFCFKGKGYSF